MRYFIELSYKGTRYNGWQRQNNAPSVQQTVEKALSTLLRTETGIAGAGRTDTGVHASYYVAHFDSDLPIPRIDAFVYHLNSILPEDVAIRGITGVSDEAHARFDAITREYKYRIITHKDPFRRETSWQYYVPLDLGAMNEAAAHILGTREFTTFSKLHSNNKTDICTVSRAEWEACGGELIFTIRADRFLRNMVRSIVGTLVDVGKRKVTPERFQEILLSKDRSLSSGSAPAQGLFLTNIEYPEDVFKRSQ